MIYDLMLQTERIFLLFVLPERTDESRNTRRITNEVSSRTEKRGKFFCRLAFVRFGECDNKKWKISRSLSPL